MKGLWYRSPAKEWEQALPLGNGRMGAMIYGGIDREHLQVNEESIWYGSRRSRENEDSLANLPRIRSLLFDGRIEEAERLMKWALSSCPQSMSLYQTLGDMYIEFNHAKDAEDYRRELDLERALASVSYVADEVKYRREYFFSYPADVMIMRLTASREGSLSFTLTLDRCKNFYDGIEKIGQNGLCLYGNLGRGGSEYAMAVRLRALGGTVRTVGCHIIVEDATEAVLVFSADCTYHYNREEKDKAWKHYREQEEEHLTKKKTMSKVIWEELCEAERYERQFGDCMQRMIQGKLSEKLEGLLRISYDQLLKEHLTDYQALFSRVSLTMDGAEQFDSLSTDERLMLAEQGEEAGLASLYLDYGRYLLISCSRPGNLPANLQGIWNKDLKPAWDSKYTININTEMNYWLAESANLSECHMPLFDLIKRMVPNGREAAKNLYGCRGFVAHHNTDIYGDCCVQDYWNPGSYWVMGAAWLCTHQWTHFIYTQDRKFLEEVFPVMREAAEFFLDFLVEHKGFLVTCPSVSPENTFVLENGHSGANTYGVTMDNQILRDLFDQCNKAARVLGVSDELDNKIQETKERLYPTQIAESGCLMEWSEEYEELDKGHRHISHLYGLHPSEQITVDGTPKLAAAARKTLESRLSNGGGHTGWSRAWIINHYAKLWDGEKAYENLLMLWRKSTYPNLFDKHPPFQIDGNFGAAAAILEMLVQSSECRIVLLPALPRAWNSGALRGVCVKGGGCVDIEWKDGRLMKATLTAYCAQSFTVIYMKGECCVNLGQGERKEFVLEDFSKDVEREEESLLNGGFLQREV